MACAKALDDECTTAFAPLLSEAYAQALHQCFATDPCDEGLAPETLCKAQQLDTATPTAAQSALAEDFCRGCAGGPSTIDHGLWCAGHVLGPGSTGPMLSTTILELSDSAAARVYAADCIGKGVQAYPTDYNNCENGFENCVGDLYPSDPGGVLGRPLGRGVTRADARVAATSDGGNRARLRECSGDIAIADVALRVAAAARDVAPVGPDGDDDVGAGQAFDGLGSHDVPSVHGPERIRW